MQIEQKTSSATINIVLDTIEKQKQALVFVNTKSSAEKTAEEIANKLKESGETLEIAEQILNVLSTPTRQCKRLHYCVKKAIAFHHAGLTHKQKDIIEESLETRR